MQHTDPSEPPSPSGPRRSRVGVVILAAGKGTRMRARMSKLVHPVAGLPMVRQVVGFGRLLQPSAMALVVGHDAEQVIAAAGDGIDVVRAVVVEDALHCGVCHPRGEPVPLPELE